MKTSDADLLIVPGYKGSGPLHWQTRWEARLSSARRVEMGDWHKPVFEVWRDNLVEAVNATTKPVVLIGHSIGSQVIVQGELRPDGGEEHVVPSEGVDNAADGVVRPDGGDGPKLKIK